MGIKQINLSYLLHEDRILFRVNTSINDEFLFLLTRRVGLFLLAATKHLMQKELEKHPQVGLGVGNEIFTRNDLPQSSDHGAEFIGGSSFPLGNEPKLVLDVNCGVNNEQPEMLISVDLIYGEKQSVNLLLPIYMVSAFSKLLEKISEHAGWGSATLLDQATSVTQNFTMDAPDGSSTIH